MSSSKHGYLDGQWLWVSVIPKMKEEELRQFHCDNHDHSIYVKSGTGGSYRACHRPATEEEIIELTRITTNK